jgi:hypothetical protein
LTKKLPKYYVSPTLMGICERSFVSEQNQKCRSSGEKDESKKDFEIHQ